MRGITKREIRIRFRHQTNTSQGHEHDVFALVSDRLQFREMDIRLKKMVKGNGSNGKKSQEELSGDKSRREADPKN